MSTAAVWQGSDAELLAELGALETRLHATWAQMLSVIAEVDSRGTATAVGYTNTIDLVRAVGRVTRGEARARIAAATDVLPTRGLGGAVVEPRLPATAAAVAEHAIGAADVRVIRSVLTRIPPHIGEETRAEVEAELASHARTLDAGQLAVLGTVMPHERGAAVPVRRCDHRRAPGQAGDLRLQPHRHRTQPPLTHPPDTRHNPAVNPSQHRHTTAVPVTPL